MSFSKGKGECLTVEEEEDIATVGTVVQQDHFVKALDQLQEAHSDTIGAPKVCTGTALCSVLVSRHLIPVLPV